MLADLSAIQPSLPLGRFGLFQLLEFFTIPTFGIFFTYLQQTAHIGPRLCFFIMSVFSCYIATKQKLPANRRPATLAGFDRAAVITETCDRRVPVTTIGVGNFWFLLVHISAELPIRGWTGTELPSWRISEQEGQPAVHPTFSLLTLLSYIHYVFRYVSGVTWEWEIHHLATGSPSLLGLKTSRGGIGQGNVATADSCWWPGGPQRHPGVIKSSRAALTSEPGNMWQRVNVPPPPRPAVSLRRRDRWAGNHLRWEEEGWILLWRHLRHYNFSYVVMTTYVYTYIWQFIFIFEFNLKMLKYVLSIKNRHQSFYRLKFCLHSITSVHSKCHRAENPTDIKSYSASWRYMRKQTGYSTCGV